MAASAEEVGQACLEPALWEGYHQAQVEGHQKPAWGHGGKVGCRLPLGFQSSLCLVFPGTCVLSAATLAAMGASQVDCPSGCSTARPSCRLPGATWGGLCWDSSVTWHPLRRGNLTFVSHCLAHPAFCSGPRDAKQLQSHSLHPQEPGALPVCSIVGIGASRLRGSWTCVWCDPSLAVLAQCPWQRQEASGATFFTCNCTTVLVSVVTMESHSRSLVHRCSGSFHHVAFGDSAKHGDEEGAKAERSFEVPWDGYMEGPTVNQF